MFKSLVAQINADNGQNFKTVIVDLITDIYEMCRGDVLKGMGITHESEGAYGKAYKKVDDEFLPTIKTLLNAKHINVIVIAHEKEMEGKMGPNLPGAVITKLQGYVQLNGRLLATQLPGKERQTKLYFMPSIREKAANIVGISKPLDPTWDELVREIREINDAKVKGEK